jgi:hypothetical protein
MLQDLGVRRYGNLNVMSQNIYIAMQHALDIWQKAMEVCHLFISLLLVHPLRLEALLISLKEYTFNLKVSLWYIGIPWYEACKFSLDVKFILVFCHVLHWQYERTEQYCIKVLFSKHCSNNLRSKYLIIKSHKNLSSEQGNVIHFFYHIMELKYGPVPEMELWFCMHDYVGSKSSPDILSVLL